MTLDLFDAADAGEKEKGIQEPSQELSGAMDTINQKFGSNTVNLGMCPKTSAGYVGTKIAFTRVPEADEFRE